MIRWLTGVSALALPFNVSASEECRPIEGAAVERQWSNYKTQSDAEEIRGGDQYECIALSESQRIVCLTRPGHPAHPTIVVRTVVAKSNGIYIEMKADTAADCDAFAKVIDDFRRLNDEMKRGLGAGKKVE